MKKYDKQRLFEVMGKTNPEFSFGAMPKEVVPTSRKLINTAERDGYITKWETTAQYIMDAARKIGDEFDKLHPEEQKVFRDSYYNNFLRQIHKK